MPNATPILPRPCVFIDADVLVTHNVRHFQPGHSAIAVLRPGEFLWRVREQLATLPRINQYH